MLHDFEAMSGVIPSYVKREVCRVFLDTHRARAQRAQRDCLAQDLCAILLDRQARHPPHHTHLVKEQRQTQIVLLDAPGFQSRSPSDSYHSCRIAARAERARRVCAGSKDN